MTNSTPGTMTLPRPAIEAVTVGIVGSSPLICHKWSEKAKRQMLDKQMKKAATAKVAKDPQADYEDSLYPLGDGYGFPAVAFKAAAVRAGTYSDMKMTFLRGAFHVLGELVPITGAPSMREDMVRISMGIADIRYRGQFVDWSAEIPLQVNTTCLSVEQVVNLFTVAGFAVGVGEWRPERDGQYGRFEVASVKQA